MNTIYATPASGDQGMHVEALQQALKNVGFDPGSIDGDFGNKTTRAISAFQASVHLSVTGTPDTATLGKLGLNVTDTLPADPTTAIVVIVDKSGIARTNWANRGQAPYGFYYGMALMFAELYKRLKSSEAIAVEIAKRVGSFEREDALKKFEPDFNASALSDDTPAGRLRHLFVLMFGLGLMESSGRYCCGWDRGKKNGWNGRRKPIKPTAENSEAGLFQTSFDILDSVGKATKSMLQQVLNQYKAHPNGFDEYFAKGARCKPEDMENVGTGEGEVFQQLSKECPGFAVEFTAVALRNISNHWNPVIKRGDTKDGLQIKQECNTLLKSVQAYLGINQTLELASPAPATVPVSTATSDRENGKQKLLEQAAAIGQREQLAKLFSSFSDSRANYWAVVDFNKPSSEERLFVFDVKSSSVKSYLVAHGKNSGERYATDFSNTEGSNCSSLGIYKTGEEYSGKHGRSVYLNGLEATNDNALTRHIVLHSADYVVPDYEGTGRAGRSEGCFVVNTAYRDEVVDYLKEGSYLIAWHSHPHFV